MAYQNVGTPRFYINVIEWLNSLGFATGGSAPRYHTLPVVSKEIFGRDNLTFPNNSFSNNGFYALLGHDAHSKGEAFNFSSGAPSYAEEHAIGGSFQISNLINIAAWTEFDGFSMAEIVIPNGTTEIEVASNQDGHQFDIGSIVLGTYFDMPHNPDLSLTMSREYGGVKTIETKGGSTLSNSYYTKPPAWGNLGAWELSGIADSDGNDIPNSPEGFSLQKSGRRIWDLSFSFLSDSSLFPDTSSLSNLGNSGFSYEGNPSANDTYANTLLHDDNFYSQVIHKTGGHLAFIFQPDNSNFNPDQFAICKFDMNSFQFKQVANGVYNVKLKIREVW